MSRYRYPGVKPFEKSDRNIFFGRDEDIAKLYDLIELEKLVVLFGKSGYGKSSILNAGIIPKLEEQHTDESSLFQSISIRFGLYVSENSLSLVEQVRRKLEEETSVNQDNSFLGSNDSLWYLFKRRQSKLPNHQFLLVFDQFEEFFSYPEAQQVQFKLELAESLYKNIPQSVRENIEVLTPEQQDFLLRGLNIKVVIAIRSDRMSDLDSLKDKLPAILYHRYELRGLSEKQAKQAILAPAALESSAGRAFVSPPFSYTNEALSKIIEELAAAQHSQTADGKQKNDIESFQLQILCQYIEAKVIENRFAQSEGKPVVISLTDLPDIPRIYEAYYLDQLAKLPSSEREAAQELIEYGLLYEDPQRGEARRLSVDAGLLVQQFAEKGATRNLLETLEDSFLLRREVNSLGAFNYELSHDTLIAPVLNTKRERETEKQRLAEEKAKQEQEAKLVEYTLRARRERHKRKLSNLLTLIAIIGLSVAVWQYKEANNAKKKAEQAQIEINTQKTAAENNLSKFTDQVIKELMQHAETYQRSGDYPLAIKALEEALEYDSTRTDVLQLLEELR